MQFRISKYRSSRGGELLEGNRVQCIRSGESRNASGRSLQKIIITVSRWEKELPEQARHLLTEKEQIEWKSWKFQHDIALHNKRLNGILAAVCKTLDEAAAAIGETVVPDSTAASIWASLRNVSCQLEKTGHKRPKRQRGRPRKSAKAAPSAAP